MIQGRKSLQACRGKMGFQRVVSLAATVSLAFCSFASSFVTQPSPGLFHHRTASGATLSYSSARAFLRTPPRGNADIASDTTRLRWPRSSRMNAAAPLPVEGDAEAGNRVSVVGDKGALRPSESIVDGGGDFGAAVVAPGEDAVSTDDGEVGRAVGVPAGEPSASTPLSSLPTKSRSSTEIPTDVAVVGNPQKVVEKEYSIEAILKELAEIQNQAPKNYCVLGTRHCSFLHQQIIELLAYALVLSGNHVFTSGAIGTNAATIRGALRAERKELLTVVLPQSLGKQSEASRDLIQKVTNVVTNPQNDHLPLDVASRLCNSYLLSRSEQLVCFAFHDSKTIIETSKDARALNMVVTELYFD